MSTVTFKANTLTTLDKEDKRAALFAVNAYNAGQIQLGQPTLPVDAGSLRNSYELALTASLTQAHVSYIAQTSTSDQLVSVGFTKAQIDAALAAMVDRVQGGESVASVLADIQTP
jgi:hypothetical protein